MAQVRSSNVYRPDDNLDMDGDGDIDTNYTVRAGNPVVSAYMDSLHSLKPIRPWVNPAGFSYPPVTDRTAVSPKDSTASDEVYIINVAGANVGSAATLKSNRQKLPPGIYGEAFITIAIPQMPSNVWFESAFALIKTVSLGIGDQATILSLDGITLYAWYVLFNIVSEARIMQGHSFDFGVYHPYVFETPNTNFSAYVTQNPLRRPGGSMLRVPFPVPWRSPLLYGIVQSGDCMLFADSLRGVMVDFLVQLQSFSECIALGTGASLEDFTNVSIDIELYRLPRSEGFIMDLWHQQKNLRPLTATWGIWTQHVQNALIYSNNSTTTVSIDLSSQSGYTKSIGVVVRDVDRMGNKNSFSNFVRINQIKLTIGTEEIVNYSDPYAIAKTSAFRRIGERLASDTTNAINIPLALDFDLHNSSGGMCFAQRTAQLKLTFGGESEDRKISISVMGFCHAVHGPTKATYAIDEDARARGVTAADLTFAGRGDYERYFD